MLNKDCRHFRGTMPCQPHKEVGITCEHCTESYDPIETRILIIKLGALGDVVRTTALLHKLKKQGTHITWITKQNAVELLNSEWVDRAMIVDNSSTLSMLLVESFDRVYSLDNDTEGARLAELSQCGEKYGYGVRPQGALYGYTETAEKWLEVSTDDFQKKNNDRTYQEWMFEICDFVFDPKQDTMILPPFPQHLSKRNQNNKWGIVVGAGKRWPQKALSKEKLIECIQLLLRNQKEVWLIGGPEEACLIAALIKSEPRLVSTGTNNSLPELIGLLSQCEGVITGDTLSMHLALALKKKTYTFIGPTSAVELEPYGVMTKLVPDMTCLCCYTTACPKETRCNEIVSFDPLIKGEGFAHV